MQFSKLRLTGFKSFVDAAELLIEPGLTGIVGPNGCGKSNLVEALRWAMGETSARRMRGTEMEDVIFGGTATRPARNIAEVTLTLHNDGRTAPPAFNHHEFLEITRRIERGTGSDYRINGKTVRARDVQILFADHASGATSPALVSQGRVAAVIAAKPAQRRDILEEAAGIGGLHARRHEAELRLKAAEGNLERAEDILRTMSIQFDGLQKQAKQAARYRAINDTIRQAEALLLHIRWQAVQADQAQARLAFEAAEAEVRNWMAAATGQQQQMARHETDLPPLRQSEQAASQQLQRLTLAIEQIDNAEKQAQASLQQARQRLAQLSGDLGRAGQIDADAEAACARLEAERVRIIGQQAGEATEAEAARKNLAAAQTDLDRREQIVQSLTQKLAEAEAEIRAAEQQLRERQAQHQKMQQALQQAQDSRQKLLAEALVCADSAAAEQAAQLAEQQLQETQAQQQQIEQELVQLAEAVEQARTRRDQDQLALRRLNSDIEALEKLLATSAIDPAHRPVIDHLSVVAGYEVALAAALAEGLEAGLERAAPRHWSGLGGLPVRSPVFWPAGVVSFAQFVATDPVLARALAHIGLVEQTDQIEALVRQLMPGQILVSRAGDVWRWDGLVSSASISGRAAQRLEQKNRLIVLQAEHGPVLAQAEASQQHFVQMQRQLEQARIQEQQLRQSVRQLMTQADQMRRKALAAQQVRLEIDSRIQALSQRIEDLTQDVAQAAQAADAAMAGIGTGPDVAVCRGALETERALLATARQEVLAARHLQEKLEREAFGRRKRLDHIRQEISDSQKRRTEAAAHQADLVARQQGLEQEIATLTARPEQLVAERQELMRQHDAVRQQHKRAADALKEAEQFGQQLAQALKQAEQKVADAREVRARAETGVSLSRQAAESLTAEIREKLDIAPEQALALSSHPADKAIPALKEQEQRWQKLLRDRDNMGAVNLRAEEECTELGQEIGRLNRERDDLTAAIARLRQGIGRLNKEAREKLLEAFGVVNGHFQDLFVRLFGGGRAHLALTEADDPLDAGLEIYASPPGKKLQHLSLLSGGEQALTAVALIFSVFLTNPSPICVLDEVDAPLDEANVDRFCTMLDEMAGNTGTRFLVISHHRLTMARMHRLFGVTMSERGVSHLVSVDLAGAERFVAV